MTVDDLRIVVIGDGAVATALCSTLGNLGFAVRRRALGECTMNDRSGSIFEDLGVRGEHRPRRVDVVTIWPESTGPSRIIQCVHRLRGEALWEGSFSAVMVSRSEQQAVSNSTLVPGCESGGTFLDVRGHTVWTLPLDLPEFLCRIRSQPPLFVEQWSRLCDRGVLGSFRSALNRIEAALANDRRREAECTAMDAVDALASVEWWVLAPDHRWERSVRELVDARRRDLSVDPVAVRRVLGDVLGRNGKTVEAG